ncbi:hypothetical protein EDD86DRAFT_109016 [Gorgonomyces haynaldii]|nr:hypothetical protein EDD86DRAFT_109016 [Gorgonomyces haynaldii]
MEFLEYQRKLEHLAEDILTEKQLLIDYDRRRQELQRANRQLMNSEQDKVFLFSNGLFVKQRKDTAKSLLQRDLRSIESEIEVTRKSVQEKVIELERMEQGSQTARTKGFELMGVSRQELQDAFSMN